MLYKLFSDGGARRNPGPGACGCVIFRKEEIIKINAKFLGEETTNNVAEYAGLIMGLQMSSKLNIKKIECYLDSELVVKQINSIYKVKDKKMKPLYKQVLSYKSQFDRISFHHIPRSKNHIADKLVNIVLDTFASSPS